MDQFLRGVGRQLQNLQQQLLPSAGGETDTDAPSMSQQTMEIIKKPRVEKVKMLERYSSAEPSPGTLFLTATHLIFVDPKNKKETWICLMHIGSVEKLSLTSAGSPLIVRCKNFRSSTFIVPREPDCHDLYTSLQQLSKPVHLTDLYCFHYTPSSLHLSQASGWDLYNMVAEYKRMGVPDDVWTLSDINADYSVCDTYPSVVVVPAAVSRHVLLASARFRSRGRLPILSYRHSNNGASICRCSQPLAGFNTRCLEDEQMLEMVRLTNSSKNNMCVVDTRPKINAMANRASGKGYESEAFYTNISFYFMAIENIHVMRLSLSKLCEVCEARTLSMSQFLTGIEASGWLRHICALLDTAAFVARHVVTGTSVLVHCSDGWDRTSQTCALAQLMLDPYYRTLHGFQVLIEKEWLTVGHKFSDRCGFLNGDPREMSPVFTQFIDATWQLTQMYPQAFQFNELFLLILHDHLFSCQFGTFIGNCERERRSLRLSERTYSLWGYMKTREAEYINALHDPSLYPGALPLQINPLLVKFWCGMYSRFEYGVHPRDSLSEVSSFLSEHSTSLCRHISLLQKRIIQLEGLMKENSVEVPVSSASDIPEVRSQNGGDSQNSTNHLTLANCSLTENRLTSENRSLSESHLTSNNSPSSRSHLTSIGSAAPVSQLTSISSAAPVSQLPGVNDSVRQLPAALRPPSESGLQRELESVAVQWRWPRGLTECSCTTAFDHFSKKYNCWKCGDVFCQRCIDRRASLPGHLPSLPAPVCQPCYRQLTASLSIDSQTA